MNLKAVILFLMLSVQGLAISSSSENYTIADLKILSSEKNYSEFFSHALDIRPSKRDQSWNNMVENLGVSYLDELGNKTKLEQAQLKLVYKLSSWPIFKNNEFFTKKRDFLFLKDLEYCLKNKPNMCSTKLNFMFNDFNHDISFSNDLIKTLTAHKEQFNDLWPYAKPLAEHELSEFYCDKSPFKDVVLDHIYSTYSTQKKLPKTIHKDCIKALSKDLKLAITSRFEYQRDSAFLTLKTSKKATLEDQSLYHLLNYLYDKKMDNKNLDITLKNLKEISKNYKLRESLLREVKNLDPFPGNIFSVKKSDKADVKTRVLFRYFPEYLDEYSRTCLSYLSGARTFPNGNPTPQCHQLFGLNKTLKILPDSFQTEYNKATFFK